MPGIVKDITMSLMDAAEIDLFAGIKPRDRATVLRMVLRDAIRSGRVFELIETACIPYAGTATVGVKPSRMPAPQAPAIQKGAQVREPESVIPVDSKAVATPAEPPPPHVASTAPLEPPLEASSAEPPRPPAASLLKGFFGQNPNTNAIV